MAFSVKNLSTNFTLADAGLSWILFFSIVYQKIVPIGFGLLFISLFFNRNSLSKSSVFTFFFKGPALWFVLYYLLLIFGLLWTDNMSFAITKLENKLSFVLLPILMFLSVRKWNNAEWKQLLIYALLFTMVMYELLALWRFIGQTENSWQFEFLSSRFSIFMHRSYFACYLVIGIILLFENVRSAFSWLSVLFILFFCIGVLQTESKAGVVCLFLVILFQFFSFLRSQYKKIIWVIISSTLFLFSTVLITNNPIKARFEAMWNAMENVQTKNNNSIESNSARIIMWNTSMDVWKGNFLFGVGTGDYDDELTKMNIKYNNQGVAEERLNSHNQFLNTGVQLGLIGFFILTMIFIVSFYVSEKRLWQLLILLVFFINFLVESFLETQAGIVLFCTLLLLFFSRENKAKLSISEQ